LNERHSNLWLSLIFFYVWRAPAHLLKLLP
jgi:hypothetical protein